MKPVHTTVTLLHRWNSSQPDSHRPLKSFSLLAILLALALLGSRAAQAATYTVTDLADNAGDTGSLRYAVNTAGDGDTIDFAQGVIGTITLTNGALVLAHSVTITGPGAGLLTVSGNHASSVFTINSGTISISGLTIANGKGSGDRGTDGGGIYGGGGTLTVSDCAFFDNTASAFGAGIDFFGTLTVNESIFTGNNSNGGASITVNGPVNINNSTFFDNTGGNGDIAILVPASTLAVNNSTFTGDSNGSIVNLAGGTVTLINSTLSGNAGPNGDLSNYGGNATVSNSILADGCINCTQNGPNLIGGNPNLSPLQYNGGLLPTMIPLPGSPAIGAGLSSTLATDQRGFTRPVGTGVASDLGAVQTSYTIVTNTNDSGTGSLRAAITTANSAGSGDIAFFPGVNGTITLASALPAITGNLDLNGPGANLLTVSGNNAVTVFTVDAGANAALSGLTIADGYGNPGGIANNGTLTIQNSVLSGNHGTGNGAGIVNNDDLVITDTTFSGNVSQFHAGGIYNQSGVLLVDDSTFDGNQAGPGAAGGGIFNQDLAVVDTSTFTGNTASPGLGGGIWNNVIYPLVVSNSIVAGNTGGDCGNCTQNGPVVIGADPQLGPLQLNGGTVPTMLPLPGSPAIQIGDPTQLLLGSTTDERGFPRLTAGKLDVGAAQTNYTSVQFVQQPTDTFFNTDISPAVTLQVLETNTSLPGPNNTDAVNGIPITLVLNGSGTLGGTLTQTTAGGVASFGDLTVSVPGTADTLSTTLTVTPSGVTPAQTLTATSNPFDVSLHSQTITFAPAPPSSLEYGTVTSIPLSATSSASLPVTFQVDSGPATIQGNVLTIVGAGTIVLEADAAANATYAAATPVVETIQVTQAASQLALTSSSNQAALGTSVTLTATVTSTTRGVPTGTVTFADGAGPLGTVTLNPQGVATLPITTLPAGTNVITAVYNGDTNFSGSSAQLTGGILVGTPGFTMTSTVSSFTLHPGQQMQWILTFTPTFGYTGTASIACTGLPVTSKCLFAPSSVTFNGSGTPVQVTVTMQIGVLTHSRSSSVAQLRPWRPLGGLPMLPAVIFWLPGTDKLLEEKYGPKRTQQANRQPKLPKVLLAALLFVLSVGAFALVGCSNLIPEPSAGQQTVTITATGAGNVSQSISVQVTVQ